MVTRSEYVLRDYREDTSIKFVMAEYVPYPQQLIILEYMSIEDMNLGRAPFAFHIKKEDDDYRMCIQDINFKTMESVVMGKYTHTNVTYKDGCYDYVFSAMFTRKDLPRLVLATLITEWEG